jgi:hypothetical protein
MNQNKVTRAFLVNALNERSDELKAILRALANGKSIEGADLSPNTCNVQRHHRTYESRLVGVFQALLAGGNADDVFAIPEEAFKGFLQLTEPQRKIGTTLEVNEGDSFLALIQKYPDAKNVVERLHKAAAAKGLRIDLASGLVVKA